MKIEVIPSVLDAREIEQLLADVDPLNTAQEMAYFDGKDKKLGARKVRCLEHPIVQHLISRLNLANVDGATIVHYPEGSHNTLHTDNSIVNGTEVQRVKDWEQTVIVFLNNDFTGGELVYPKQGCRFMPVPGTAVIAPAGPEYPHLVTRVTSGDRFVIVIRVL